MNVFALCGAKIISFVLGWLYCDTARSHNDKISKCQLSRGTANQKHDGILLMAILERLICCKQYQSVWVLVSFASQLSTFWFAKFEIDNGLDVGPKWRFSFDIPVRNMQLACVPLHVCTDNSNVARQQDLLYWIAIYGIVVGYTTTCRFLTVRKALAKSKMRYTERILMPWMTWKMVKSISGLTRCENYFISNDIGINFTSFSCSSLVSCTLWDDVIVGVILSWYDNKHFLFFIA